MGRLMPGPASSGPNPLEEIGSGRLIGGVGPGPKVPTIGGEKIRRNEILIEYKTFYFRLALKSHTHFKISHSFM